MFSKLLILKKRATTLNKEWLEFIVISVSAFFIPFFIGHPQIIVGVLVNLLLIKAAYNLSMAKTWPLIFLPSLGVISRGLLFASLTPFLFYVLPFIFMGNFIFVYSLKKLRNFKFYYNLFIPTFLKALIIASGVYVFIKLGLIPAVLLNSMSVWQFINALIAIVIYQSIGWSYKNLLRK